MGSNEIPLGLEANETVNKVIQYFNTSVFNLTNQSGGSEMKPFDLYDAYKDHEQKQLILYKYIAYIVGILIILSNLIVVISSGLILKKGQQPKSTYLLLGNVSLADTIIGISIIVGSSVENTMNTDMMCIFQIGMLVCPAMVSIFSVGMIAVDRYIYILHGLYYQRWFNTTKVRIGIVCIWMIGTILGFVPLTGWRNHELDFTRQCNYVSLFPASVVIFNTMLSFLPILLVAVLYSIILVSALKNVKKIKAAKSYASNLYTMDQPGLRISRGNSKTMVNSNNDDSANFVEYPIVSGPLKRSASLDSNLDVRSSNTNKLRKSSISCLSNRNGKTDTVSKSCEDVIPVEDSKKSNSESEFSIYTIESQSSEQNVSVESTKGQVDAKEAQPKCKCCWKKPNTNKPRQPNKWRAITIVMLTSGSFIVTWVPFFVLVIFFVLCEDKRYNPRCFNMMVQYGPPFTTLAFFNSILNPLIYAWWHKGFQKSVRAYYKKYFQIHCT